MCSLFFVGSLLLRSLLCRNRKKRESPFAGWSVLLVPISVFCLAMLMIIFVSRNPGPMAFEDQISVSVLTAIGVISFVFAVRLTR